MKYRPDKNGTMISQLGYGCMSFTRKGPNIDFEKAEQEIQATFAELKEML